MTRETTPGNWSAKVTMESFALELEEDQKRILEQAKDELHALYGKG
jgi:hypothetical protein